MSEWYGSPSQPADEDSATTVNYTYIITRTACPVAGNITKIQLYQNYIGTDDMKFAVFTKSGNNFTDKPGDQTINVSPGYHEFTSPGDFTQMAIEIGEYFGFFGRAIERDDSGGGGDGYWFDQNDQIGDEGASAFTESATTREIQMRVWIDTGAAYSITIGAGSYGLSGQPTNLLKGSLVEVAPGSYALGGQVAGLLKGSRIDIASGSYVLAGQIISLLKGSHIDIASGSYVLSGQVIDLLKSSHIDIVAGSYALAGQIINLLKGSHIDIEAGSYVLIGMDVDFVYSGAEYFPIFFDVIPRDRILDAPARLRVKDVNPRDRIFDTRRT